MPRVEPIQLPTRSSAIEPGIGDDDREAPGDPTGSVAYPRIVKAPTSRRTRGLLVVVFVVIAASVLVVYLWLEGPDQSRVGVVTIDRPHRVCVESDDGEFCAHVNTPAELAEIEVGDCIELRRSSDEVFESARLSDLC
jgi:hypothetical protein